MYDDVILDHEKMIFFDGMFYPICISDQITVYRNVNYEMHQEINITAMRKVFGKVILGASCQNRDGHGDYTEITIGQLENLLGDIQ